MPESNRLIGQGFLGKKRNIGLGEGFSLGVARIGGCGWRAWSRAAWVVQYPFALESRWNRVRLVRISSGVKLIMRYLDA